MKMLGNYRAERYWLRTWFLFLFKQLEREGGREL